MDVGVDHPPEAGMEEARKPTLTDLVSLCRELNDRNALYLAIGGFAIRAAGYDRTTMDLDLLKPICPFPNASADTQAIHFCNLVLPHSVSDGGGRFSETTFPPSLRAWADGGSFDTDFMDNK